MKLLFFDTEFSNCFGKKAKMCEFGYVVTDERFNILSRADIPMCPGIGREYRFDESVYKRDPKFQWAYEEDVYFSLPEFNHYYNEIKKLLTAEDTLVFGFDIANDIKGVADSVDRFKLEPIIYESYDIQKMLKMVYKRKEMPRSLDSAFIRMFGKFEFKKRDAHLSRDDAEMTMLIFKELCSKLDVHIDDMINTLCPESKYILGANGRILRPIVENGSAKESDNASSNLSLITVSSPN